MTKYNVVFEVDCTVEIDSKVIDRVDDEWRKHLYDLKSERDIVEHIAYNLVINRYRLSELDGWADMDDSMARIVSEYVEVIDLEGFTNSL